MIHMTFDSIFNQVLSKRNQPKEVSLKNAIRGYKDKIPVQCNDLIYFIPLLPKHMEQNITNRSQC